MGTVRSLPQHPPAIFYITRTKPVAGFLLPKTLKDTAVSQNLQSQFFWGMNIHKSGSFWDEQKCQFKTPMMYISSSEFYSIDFHEPCLI